MRKMIMKNNYDILIVGGGPAGVSSWLHLQKYAPELAQRTLLIEKEKYPRDKLCGGGVLGLGDAILKKIDSTINIPSVPIHTFEYRLGDDVFCHRQQNFCRIVRRIEFDHALEKIALEKGLHVNEEEMFLDFLHRDNNLTVKTNRRTYRVKALIGADGATSKVRKQMNLPIKPCFASAIEFLAPSNPRYDTELNNNTAVMDFTPTAENLQGYVWHFPCIRNGKPWMNHGIYDVHINREKPFPNLKTIFSHTLQQRKITSDPSHWVGAPISWFAEKPTLSTQNILLVGDAAGIEPLTGAGIHLSLFYGSIAAKTIQDAFQQDNFSFKEYSTQVQSSFIGKIIQQCTYFSREVYHGRMNILEVMKKIVLAKP